MRKKLHLVIKAPNLFISKMGTCRLMGEAPQAELIQQQIKVGMEKADKQISLLLIRK